MGTPDIWNEIDKVNAWADQNNEKFEAVICSNSLHNTLLEQTYNKYKNVQTAFFETESEALKWLNIKLLADKN